jgi:GLPGLI family protein
LKINIAINTIIIEREVPVVTVIGTFFNLKNSLVMNKLISLVIGIVAFTAVNGQTSDSAYFQAFYKLNYVKDLLTPEKVREDEMLLSIGYSSVSFYSYKNFLVDSLRKANPDEYMPSFVNNTMLSSKTTLHSSLNHVQYFFDKQRNELSCLYNSILGKKYRYSEKYNKPEWKISGDTTSILGYLCQKAMSNYGGRKWTVWFAAEIPIPEGPWKLKGLPGLILKAEDDTRSFVFECTGTSRLQKKKPIVKDDKERRELSREAFIELYVREFNDPDAVMLADLKERLGLIPTSDSKPLLRQLNPFEIDGI